MSLIKQPGIYPLITPAQYFDEPCPAPALTSSTISIMLNECDAKAAWSHPAINQPKDDAAKELEKYLIGSGAGKPAQALRGVVHRMALGKGAEYVVSDWEEYRTKEAKAWRDEAWASGSIPLKPKQHEQAQAMASVMADAIAEATQGEPYETEVVVAWQEPSGIWCRGMLDIWVPSLGLILDVKTSAGISDDAIDGYFNRWGYSRQSAFYRRGVDAVTGGASRFDFLFVENEAPWLTRTVDTSEGFRTGSTMEIESAIERWGKCIASGEWSGYGRRTVSPRAWKVKEWLEDGYDVEMEEV
jgi:hypothetical protein